MKYDMPDLATQDEIKPVDVQGPVNLKVKEVEDRQTKAGGPMTVLKIGFVDYPESPDFYEYLWHPTDAHDAQTSARQRVRIKRVKAVFGLDPNEAGYDSNDFVGRTGYSPIAVEKQEGFEAQNKLDPPPFE